MIILEFCDVPDIPVFIDFGLGWAFLEPFKIGLNMGVIKYGKSRENGFLGKFSGGSRGIFGKSCFWLIFGIWWWLS